MGSESGETTIETGQVGVFPKILSHARYGARSHPTTVSSGLFWVPRGAFSGLHSRHHLMVRRMALQCPQESRASWWFKVRPPDSQSSLQDSLASQERGFDKNDGSSWRMDGSSIPGILPKPPGIVHPPDQHELVHRLLWKEYFPPG